MGALSNSFSVRIENFAGQGNSSGDYTSLEPNPKTVTREDAPRKINFKGIDYVYGYDTYSYATINKPVQWIMNCGFKITSDKKSVSKFFNDFFDNIGFLGDDIMLEELHDELFRDGFKYGNCFVELIYDETDTFIIDVRRVIPYRIDYARDNSGKIAIDKYAKSIGYVIEDDESTVGMDRFRQPIDPSINSNISTKGNDRFIEAKRIAHIKFNKDSNGYWGNGFIQPALESIFRRLKIEEAEVNTIYTKSQQPLIANVGDERHEASEDDLKKVVDVLANIKHDRIFAFPDWVKVAALETSDNQSANTAIDRLSTANSAASGVPMGFLTGKDGDAQRGTLSAMQTMLEANLDYYIKAYSMQFKKLVMNRIADSHGIDKNVKLVWNTVVSEDKNDKVNRLFTYFQMNTLSPEEIREIVVSSEDIERNDKSYDKFIQEKIDLIESGAKEQESKSKSNNLKEKTQPEGSQSEKDQEKRELMDRKE